MDKPTLFRKKLHEVLHSKVDEFHLLGYDSVTADDIWQCVTAQYSEEAWPPLYHLVNEIFSLKVTDFMNWLTVSAYRGSIDFGKNELL